MQKFNDITIITKFIKELLKDYYIPTIPFWKPGDIIYKNWLYYSKNNILRASWSGDEISKQTSSINDEYDSNYFKVIRPYIENTPYKGLTSNYISNANGYDVETHKALGKYLHHYRNIHGVDLMPYYNCWTGETLEGYTLNDNLNLEKTVGKSLYTLLSVPIQFNKQYTLILDTNYTIKYKATLSTFINEWQDLISQDIVKGTINRCNSLVIKQDQVINIPSTQNIDYLRNAKYLTLYLEIPKTLLNKVIILEGNYYNSSVNVINSKNSLMKRIVNNRQVSTYQSDDSNAPLVSLEEKENMIIVSPSLSRKLDNNIYAFSDRLIEYLASNVILPDDELWENVERCQEAVSSYTFESIFNKRYKQIYTKGIWANNLREFIYDVVTTNDRKPLLLDINGYVDKDTEQLILSVK